MSYKAECWEDSKRKYGTQQPRVISGDCKPKYTTKRQEQKRHKYDEKWSHAVGQFFGILKW